MRIIVALCALFTAGFAHADTGFIVAAPDRGFMGNEETRDAFAAFDAAHPAALVFVTGERGQAGFDAAVQRLRAEGVDRFVVLPLYLSAAHPDLDTVRGYARANGVEVGFGRVFGASAPATVALADRVRAAGDGPLVVVADGEGDAHRLHAMHADVERLVAAVRPEFPGVRLDAAVWARPDDIKQVAAGTVVVPFHLGSKLDSMMSFTAGLARAAPDGVRVVNADVTPHPAVAAWLSREAARHRPIPADRLGVVIHAHGADFHWNQQMRDAAAGLERDHLVAYAFSMGDPPTLERAVRRLEQRGAQAVVIVRVFGLARSFTAGIDRFIGADYEAAHHHHATHDGGHGHGHGHGVPSAAPARLLTPLPVVSVGGLEAHPHFADALLQRAEALSTEPARETIVLVAHGVGDDRGNDYWMELLGKLRARMLANGGARFRAIETATWREDWPDKRAAAVAGIRELIQRAHADGGRAIVVPARTTGTGGARDLIPDLEYELASGFAPHPLFVEWLREQVASGAASIHGNR